MHDAPAVRLVVFRIEPGQEVTTNDGTVVLTVLSGRGTISGADESHDVAPGTVVGYAPHEPRGMHAGAGAVLRDGHDHPALLRRPSPSPAVDG